MFVRRVIVATAIVALAAVILFLAAWGIDVVLLAFAGVLLALFLRGLTDFVAEHTGLRDPVALAAVIVGLIALLGASGWLVAPPLAEQGARLARRLPEAVSQMQARLGETEWGQILLARAPDPENLERYLGRAGGTLAATLGWTLGGLANLAIVLFVAVYVAADPDTYRQGLLRLVPPASRPRAEEVLARLGATLQRWLIGQLIAMVTIGTAVAVGLTLLGVPLALALGLLAGLLNFVPYLGPVLAFVPAALLALTEGVPTLLWVLGLYALIQALESYVVTPLIQQQAVALPPALIILAQVLLAVTVGWLGLLLATPLTAAVVVVIDMLYVEARREPAAVRSPARLGRGGSGRAG